MLGVSRVSISKALKQLEAEDLIAIGYGRVALKDLARLQKKLDAETQVSPVVPEKLEI